MFNKKLGKTILFVFVCVQSFSSLLALVNMLTNPNYQPHAWGYLIALVSSAVFASLLLIKTTSKTGLLELFFDVKSNEQKG